MKKKLIVASLVLVVILILGFADIANFTLMLKAPDQVKAGENIEFSVAVTNNPGIAGMTFKIAYSANLKLENYQVGDVLALPVEPPSLKSPALFYFDVGESLQQSTETGQLIKFVFKAADIAQAETAFINVFEIEAVNENDQTVELTSQGHKVNIITAGNETAPQPTTEIISKASTEIVTRPTNGSVPNTEAPAIKNSDAATSMLLETNANHFTDIRVTDWYFDAVKWCYQNKLMNGTSETTFSANQPMTRAMLVTVLYRLADQPSVKLQNQFNDVKPIDYYNKAVNWAVQNSIITGYNSEVFGADDDVTRQQIATILYRYSKVAKLPNLNLSNLSANYKDADKISDYAKDGLNYCIQLGIIAGKSDNLLDPQNKATRAEVATMLQRFAQKIQ